MKTNGPILRKQAEQTGESSTLRGDQISAWGQAEHCSACRSDQIPHTEQGKGENNQQIKDEDLLCVEASRAGKGASNQQIEGEPLTSAAKVSTPTSS